MRVCGAFCMGNYYGGRTSDFIAVDVKIDARQFRAEQKLIIGSEMPFAMAMALSAMAKELQGVAEKEIAARYDRPTRWTKKSLFTWPARKADFPTQSAGVYFKDYSPKGVPAGRYLHPSIVGKARSHKGFEKALIRSGLMRPDEYAIPAKGVRLNQYGNVSQGLVRKVLSQLKSGDPYQWETTRSRKRGKTGRLSGARYFIPSIGSKLPRGIYQRTGRGAVKMLFIFVTDRPDYKVILPFKQIENEAAMRPLREYLIGPLNGLSPIDVGAGLLKGRMGPCWGYAITRVIRTPFNKKNSSGSRVMVWVVV